MARTITGRVTSDKANKTIVITVATRKTHPLYKKQFSVSTKFMAHDEDNQAKVGDLVEITETRPISARKRFKLARVVEKAGIEFAEADATADIPEEPKEEQPAPKAEPKAAKEAKEPKEVKAPKESK